MSTVDETIQEYIRLHAERKELKDQLKRVDTAMAEAQGAILEHWDKTDTASMKTGGHMLYRQRWMSTRVQTDEPVVQLLIRTKMSNCLMLSTQSLHAVLKEKLWDPRSERWELGKRGKLSTAIREAFDIGEYYRLNLKKG